MRYRQALKDVSGMGTMGSPGDNLANYVWNHPFSRVYEEIACSPSGINIETGKPVRMVMAENMRRPLLSGSM